MCSFVVLNCLKFVRRCKRYLKLRRIRTKMAVRLKWEELSGRKLGEAVQRVYAALSRASRRLPMSRGHKLTLGTNARESRLARRRRRRRTALSCDASGGLKTAGLHLYWLAAMYASFPRRRAAWQVNRAGCDAVYSGRNFPKLPRNVQPLSSKEKM